MSNNIKKIRKTFGGCGFFCIFAASEMTSGWYSLKARPTRQNLEAVFWLLFYLPYSFMKSFMKYLFTMFLVIEISLFPLKISTSMASGLSSK